MILGILLLAVSVLMVGRTVKKFTSHEIGFLELFGWLVFWSALGVVALFPDATSVLANYVGVGRGADLALYTAIVVLFILMFRLFAHIERLERNMTKVVRAIALQSGDDNEEKK